MVEDAGQSENGSSAPRSLWLLELSKSPCFRKLLSSKKSDDVKANLTGLSDPFFSLDGSYIYVNADAWATSSAVHRVNVKTGTERFVIDGGVQGVLRTGPYRGMLLVQRHKYHPAPQLGSYDPVDVVRPDGEVMLTVPGSETDEGEPSVARWLKAHGWSAS